MAWSKEKFKEYQTAYRRKNLKRLRIEELDRWNRDREKRLLAARNRAKERRLIVIKHYGGKCACCLESRIEFMAIDHINGGGSKEYRKNRMGNHRYKHLIDSGFPKKYRILCHNCNMSLGFYGFCPHNKDFK